MSSIAGRMGVWLVVLLALLVSGCRECTLIGCLDSVTFKLSDAVALFRAEEPVEVRACLESDCITETLTVESGSTFARTPRMSLDLTTGTLAVTGAWTLSESRHTVSIELRRIDRGLKETWADVQITGEEINGPGCGFCYRAVVEL
jgi:hypothetical protein